MACAISEMYRNVLDSGMHKAGNKFLNSRQFCPVWFNGLDLSE